MDRRAGAALAVLIAGTGLVFALGTRDPSSPPTAFPEPGRQVRHIIPWRAGGGTDAAMRGFATHLERHLGVRVITENVPGGLSAVGLAVVQNAPPDGYTIGTMTYDVLTVESLGLAPLGWRTFEPICTVTDHPSALIAPGGRWLDVNAFRAEATTSPGTITVGNVGQKGIWHQHAIAMEQSLSIELRHVPYEGGSGPQLAAVLGGEVDAIVSSLPGALPYLRDGTLRVLGVMAAERSPLVEEAPTFRELGYDLEYGGFRILVAPGETPVEIVATLEAACRRTAEDPEFLDWARGAAIGAAWLDRAQTRAYLEGLAPQVQRLMRDLAAR